MWNTIFGHCHLGEIAAFVAVALGDLGESALPPSPPKKPPA
jgi:hypothetical protein